MMEVEIHMRNKRYRLLSALKSPLYEVWLQHKQSQNARLAPAVRHISPTPIYSTKGT